MSTYKLDAHDARCGYKPLPCPQGCGESVIRMVCGDRADTFAGAIFSRKRAIRFIAAENTSARLLFSLSCVFVKYLDIVYEKAVSTHRKPQAFRPQNLHRTYRHT